MPTVKRHLGSRHRQGNVFILNEFGDKKGNRPMVPREKFRNTLFYLSLYLLERKPCMGIDNAIMPVNGRGEKVANKKSASGGQFPPFPSDGAVERMAMNIQGMRVFFPVKPAFDLVQNMREIKRSVV